MYCRNCGKYIGTEKDFCTDCLKIKNTGRASALTTSILSVALNEFLGVFAYLLAFLLLYAMLGLNKRALIACMVIIGVVVLCIIASFILGIISIVKYKTAKRKNKNIPVIVFVFGLIGTIQSAFFFLYMLFSMFYYFITTLVAL